MKKLFSFILVLTILLLCVACSPKEAPPMDTTAAATTTTPPTTSGTPDAVSSLNGIELASFSVVYSSSDHDYSKRAAEYIASEVLTRTGISLPVIDDAAEVVSDYEIVVGETSREISARLDAEREGMQFAILAEEKQIALKGDYFIIAAAAYFFVEAYVPEANFSAEIPKEISIHEPIVKKAKNYILLIGDGMGLYQTLLFDVLENNEIYGDGEDIFYGYYFPYRSFARTNSLSGTTDSAAAGTALSCGTKTINGYVGQNKNHREIQSITELAASLGKSTAVMSTEGSVGATPAAFSAHADDRYLSEDILSDQAALTEENGTIILGNFDRYTKGGIKRIETAITSTLDTLDNDEDGFFLMYEEAYVDKHSHSNQINNTFQALVRFNQAIAVFMEYAFYNPDTFVLITADHETGDLRPNGSGVFSYNSSNHSSAYVPVFAYGDGGECFDCPIIENIQIPQTIASFMGVNDFGDQTKFKPLLKVHQ